MSEFIKVCPNCKSTNIKQKFPQLNNSWFCLTCGNSDFFPVEVNKKELK